MYMLEKDVKLSANFCVSEFACKGGGGRVLFDMELVRRLQGLRDYFKRPIVITSGYRTRSYNDMVGGAENSQHIYGRAADIKVVGIGSDKIAAAAIRLGFRGVGIYENFVHVDVRKSLVNRLGRAYDIWRA
ncbi:Peptidase M15 [Peptoclostridium litorale DSM 5388]|uniref:Murein endopeptidase K n=1 Tax=Peptoclostridium litorale DSM 5388 TaxID=1121324 RepID=A0A069RC79_PEPLI|nr:D-Ala-D-Ala carboxypeptidase family metallohydrolase [Peptoclostridium litorale]KDR94606.1 peptidase M15A [Peptoclostridium litorale DSM 5388]SIO32041.1 Peptidase M15 [Peptoclostridium litorale DSM 5388]